jgi:hypothetical protein
MRINEAKHEWTIDVEISVSDWYKLRLKSLIQMKISLGLKWVGEQGKRR